MRRTRSLVLCGLVLLLLVAPAWADSDPECDFDAGALPAQTAPGRPHGGAIPIDTIVVLMQENRSFDTYFGQLHAQAHVHTMAEPAKASNPDPLGGAPITPFHKTEYCEVADLDHSWNGTHREWDGGAMDGFTTANENANDASGSRTMGFYDSSDLPFYYALYSTFAIGDHFFCSVLSQTFPNRFFLLAGTAFGHIRNDLPTAPTDFAQPTIFNRLDDAGVPWKIYFSEEPFAFEFAYVRNQKAANTAPIQQYFSDAQAGTLPHVVFVDPIFNLTGEQPKNTENDEHPPANIQVGEQFVANVVNALLQSPQWTHAALFVVYDEHGGFYDHVPPPPACVPDAIPPMLQSGDEPGAFDRYGIRVPVVVVSPYARRHYVSHRVYDHTSILRFIETRFDLPALTKRDANADPMLRLFKFGKPPFLVPPTLPVAPLDATRENAQVCQGSPGPPVP